MELVKDADIMRSLIERLRVRIQQGSPTFFVKIKSHRGEPLNERADEEAGKGCRLDADVKQWDAPTSRILYAWESDLGVKRQVPWGPSVRKMITKRAGRARVAMEYQASHRAWLKEWWQASDWSGLSPDETGVANEQGDSMAEAEEAAAGNISLVPIGSVPAQDRQKSSQTLHNLQQATPGQASRTDCSGNHGPHSECVVCRAGGSRHRPPQQGCPANP